MSAYVQTVVGSDSPPVGAVMDFAGNVEPSGWLFCFGQSLPRTGMYAQLFSVIGTLYGSLDGSSFNLPDFRGRVVAGKDNMGGTAANRLTTAWGVDGVTLGANGGTESHQLTIAQLAAHTHTEQRTVVQAGGNINTAAGTTALSTFSQNTGLTGGDAAHPNVQPTFIVNKIIKYTVSGTVLPIVPGDGDVIGPDGGVADGDLAVFSGTSGKFIRRGSLFPRGHLSGLTVANGTDTVNDIDIAMGGCRDDTNSADIVIPTVMTKRLDATWAAGTNQGGLDTGTIADNTYHLFVIRNPTTGVCDALFSANLASPTMPSGFTQKRRISSHVRWLGRYGGLAAFRQNGDSFQPYTTANDAPAPATGGVNTVLLAALPNGIKWFVQVAASFYSASGIAQCRLSDPDQSDNSSLLIITPGAGLACATGVSLWCSTGRTINWSIPFNSGAGTCTLGIYVQGWWDTRGKDR